MEPLEDRLNPSYVVFDLLDRIILLELTYNGRFNLTTSEVSTEIHFSDQSDHIVNFSQKTLSLYLNGGDDFVDGAEGGPVFIDCGSGNDKVVGSVHNDSIIGSDGTDTLFGGAGNDILIGETSPIYQTVYEHLSLQISNDILDGGNGFNIVNGETELRLTPTLYANPQNAQQIITSNPNQTIQLEPGIYPVLYANNVSIVGNNSYVQGIFGSNLYLKDLILTCESPQNYQGSTAHNILSYSYLDNIEVYGGVDGSAALYFTGSSVITNSYVHNTAGDGISTGGTGLLEIINSVGHTAGPLFNHQVITAHFGLNVVVWGGTYSDAHTNVIAPDLYSTIDLYNVTILKGARQSGVYCLTPSIIEGCYIETAYMPVYGSLINSTIIYNGLSYGYLISLYGSIENCYLINTKPSVKGVQVRADSSIIDCVFENFNGLEIILNGFNLYTEGNSYV